MGFIDLICITADPDATTFYGLAYTHIQEQSPSGNYDTQNLVLVKSNTNPSSPSNLTWSVVSRIDSWELVAMDVVDGSGVFGSTEFSCTVNAQGVFTVFREPGYYSTTGLSGMRYDPTGTKDPSSDSQGPGTWMNMTIDSGYNWSGDSRGQVLKYVNNGTSPVLVHAFLDKYYTMHIGIVNEATKTLTGAAVWSMVSEVQLSPEMFVFSSSSATHRLCGMFL